MTTPFCWYRGVVRVSAWHLCWYYCKLAFIILTLGTAVRDSARTDLHRILHAPSINTNDVKACRFNLIASRSRSLWEFSRCPTFDYARQKAFFIRQRSFILQQCKWSIDRFGLKSFKIKDLPCDFERETISISSKDSIKRYGKRKQKVFHTFELHILNQRVKQFSRESLWGFLV